MISIAIGIGHILLIYLHNSICEKGHKALLTFTTTTTIVFCFDTDIILFSMLINIPLIDICGNLNCVSTPALFQVFRMFIQYKKCYK